MKRWLPVVLLLAVSPFFISCGEDDDDNASSPTAPAAAPTAVPAPPGVGLPKPDDPNRPPKLSVRTRPALPNLGAAPADLSVSLCGSVDPDGDYVTYVFQWDDGHRKFSETCQQDHTYTEPGTYHPEFCIYDDHGAQHGNCRTFTAKVS